MSKYHDRLTDHDYDGIQEFDNPMPSWWVNLFFLSILWAGFYVVALGMGWINGYQDDLRAGQSEVQAMKTAHEASKPKVIINDATLTAAIADAAQVKAGAKVFGASCASCHGAAGEGMIGPNLTDKFWLYGGKPIDQFNIIAKGIEGKMPAWESILQVEERVALVAFIASIKGTNPPNAKEPQGDEFKPEAADGDKKGDAPAAPAAPTEKTPATP